ncbi:MAG: hypothetical protein A2W28_08415 [Gammaproteobacteria bacterium RBG_16_51_14]|nr:MAG: hypothetical protein A2W28_08415 [Gammaproteobacteria bacterium RBG_16_51_14]
MKTASFRILFITLSNIGDAIMTTPVLQALHQIYPDATIDIVGDRRSGQVFQYCPYRGTLITKDKRAGFIGSVRFLQELRKTKYDLIVDLRTDGFAYLLRARARLTKQRANKDKLHAAEQHMSVINRLRKDLSIPAPTLWLDESDEIFANKILAVLPGADWLTIGPGCGGPEKVWPGERYRELAERCSGLFDAVILVGGQGDVKYADIIKDGLTRKYLDLCGKTDLLQVAAVLKRSRIYIGSDSGLGHIASAVSTPTISLFGPGSPERYRPWGRQSVWIRGADNDIRNISVEQVMERLHSHFQQIVPSRQGV